jgi:hypothetical protein
MFEESDGSLQGSKKIYKTVFDQKMFPIINVLQICHNKSWFGSGSGLNPYPAKYLSLDPDSVSADPKHRV